MRGSSCTSIIKGRFAVSGITEEALGGGGCGRVLIVESAAAGAMMWLSGWRRRKSISITVNAPSVELTFTSMTCLKTKYQ